MTKPYRDRRKRSKYKKSANVPYLFYFCEAMIKKRSVTRTILLGMVIVAYEMAASGVPAAGASMEQPPTSLHKAAKAVRIADVNSLISKGADVNAKDGGGRTPLHYTIQLGHREIAELLLSEQIRLLSGDLAQIALARKRLQQLTNHATPFEKKLLDIEELLVRLMIKDILPVLEWEKLKGLKIKEILNGLDEQNKAYFEANPESQSDKTEMLILSLLKNAINEFLEAGRILDESDATYDDDALFSKVLYVLSKRQETAAQQIFARLIKNLSDRQDKVTQLEEEVSSLEARLHKERHEFSKMGENNYKIYTVGSPEPGGHVSIEGDVNNDGFNDILIAEYSRNNFTGRVLLFYGAKDIDFSFPDIIFEGENDMDLFGCGYQPGVFADINNDGYDDIVIGAYGYDDSSGRVYIYYGGPDIDNISDVTIDGEKGIPSRFGQSIDVEDIDNDGFNDVIIGAQDYDRRRGRVYLFWGGETLDTTAAVILEGEHFSEANPNATYNKLRRQRGQTLWSGGWFGRQLDASGDVNGDGYKDILIGARRAGGKKDNGCAYLFLGNTKENMDAVCDHVFRGKRDDGKNMGSSLALFDIDNDGVDDVIVGARFAKNYRGAVYIWWGGQNFDGNRPADIVLEGEPYSNMGGDDLVCGDFNNDGYGDVLAGAYNYPAYSFTDGRAYVFYGNEKALMDTDCDYIFDPEEETDFFGFTVSVGDVNNDGDIDAILGAPTVQDRKIYSKVFLYFGPFVTEDIQEEIKAQQEIVKQVEKELSDAKQKAEDARKFVPSSADLEGVFQGLPENLHRFLTPELKEWQKETVVSLGDDSYVLREGIRENRIGMSDIELSAYIDEWTSKIDGLEGRDNRNKEQEEELETLKEQLWHDPQKLYQF